MLTLADWAKLIDPSGKISLIVEMLGQTNEIVNDMPFIEGNLPTGHRAVIRTGLPTVYWRLLNQGTAPSKGTTAQITEHCGMLDAWCEVDQKLADLNNNTNAFLMSQAHSFIDAMSQEMASTIFYGNSSTSPEEFTGLSPRYSSTSADNAQNIILGGSAGGQTDNSSIWLIGWGENKVHGMFPKGSQAGLKHENLGLVTVEVTAGIAGNRMRAYQNHWTWDCGVCVPDWRYAVRIPNIDISLLIAKTTAADLVELMIKAIHRLPSLTNCKPVFYMNRTVFEMLDIQRRDDVISGGGLTMQNVDGQVQYSFRGIPVKICDALLESEDRVA